MSELLNIEALIALLTLTGLEIVLGIDNIVFLALLTGRLPAHQQRRARQLGLLGALGMRIVLLLFISWIMQLTATLFSLFGNDLSGRDLILIGGGLFLIAKATHEVHHRLEEVGGQSDAAAMEASARRHPSFAATIVQVMLLDIVFSLDSVITAVGMAQHLPIMIAAVVIAVGVMMVFAGAIGRFIERHPTMKMLALSFLLLIGVVLVADGLGKHIEKGYIYFAMAFSLGVELLNLRTSRRHPPAAPAPQPPAVPTADTTSAAR